MEASASEPECSGDELSRPIYGQPDPMIPALGVVGGTLGWMVRGITSISLFALAAMRIDRVGMIGLILIFYCLISMISTPKHSKEKNTV
jgi:hypothetical protein